MEKYKSDNNIEIIEQATSKMLKDLFNIEQEYNKTRELVYDIMYIIENNYSTEKLSIQDLNKLTLTKIKEVYSDSQKQDFDSHDINENVTENFNDIAIDENNISLKLNELEKRRNMIPKYKHEQTNIETDFIKKDSTDDRIFEKHISQVVFSPSSHKEQNNFKTLIINSLNRDCEKCPKRNNLKINVTLSCINNTIIPYCICFPSYVKTLTPYVLMHITDGNKNIYYSFTCNKSNDNNIWDVWQTIDNAEAINMGENIWCINFLDFTNNELQLGYDNVSITSVKNKNEDDISLTLNNEDFSVGDNICLRLPNKKQIYKKVKSKMGDVIDIDNNINMPIEEIINASVMNLNKQYSFIVKYALRT